MFGLKNVELKSEFQLTSKLLPYDKKKEVQKTHTKSDYLRKH